MRASEGFRSRNSSQLTYVLERSTPPWKPIKTHANIHSAWRLRVADPISPGATLQPPGGWCNSPATLWFKWNWLFKNIRYGIACFFTLHYLNILPCLLVSCSLICFLINCPIFDHTGSNTLRDQQISIPYLYLRYQISVVLEVKYTNQNCWVWK